MRVIADTSGVIALLDRSDKHHQAVKKVVVPAQLFIPLTILPEVDYLVTKYLGEVVSRTFLGDITSGAFKHINLDLTDIENIVKIMTVYADIPIGFVDASLLVLSDRYSISHILTLDRRHFSIMRSQTFDSLTLLP